MTRPLRIEYGNASYHIINRGNQRSTVFHDDWHYKTFIEKLGYFATEFHVRVYAYCCMPNHFHLYVCTKEANLSRFMQSFLTSYCVSSNKKRRSSGHIFQGRFKAHLVEDNCYQSRLSRYIHLNPIRTQYFREASPEERHEHLHKFKWSSYRYYLGITNKPKWLDCEPVLLRWGDKERQRMQNYGDYVEEGLRKELESPFDDVVEQSVLGSVGFVDWVKREYLLGRQGNKEEEASLGHLQKSFSFEEIIDHVASIYEVGQDLIINRKSCHREARRFGMYSVCYYCRHTDSLSDLAKRFSVSVSALTQARDRVMNDSSRQLRQNLEKIESMICKS